METYNQVYSRETVILIDPFQLENLANTQIFWFVCLFLIHLKIELLM